MRKAKSEQHLQPSSVVLNQPETSPVIETNLNRACITVSVRSHTTSHPTIQRVARSTLVTI